LDHAGLGDLLEELDDLEAGVWGVWGWLADDGVACEQGGDDLADGEDDWEVPCDVLVAKPTSRKGRADVQGMMAPTTPSGVYRVVMTFSSSSTRSSGSSRVLW